MPFNPDGSFTDVAGATTAAPGDVIHSATWNAINTDYQTAFTAVGQRIVVIQFVIDGGGAAITPGVKGDVTLPFAVTLTQATLLADQAGNAVLDIWSDSYVNFPPTVADTITASTPPTLAASIKSQDNGLTGWTVAIPAGNTLRLNVNSASTITRLTLALRATRTVP